MKSLYNPVVLLKNTSVKVTKSVGNNNVTYFISTLLNTQSKYKGYTNSLGTTEHESVSTVSNKIQNHFREKLDKLHSKTVQY